jgi:DNA primase
MNTQQARRIPLVDILARLGYQPVKEVRSDLWYLSPFRRETEASFNVNVARNVWYDHGEGVGATSSTSC